jgi:Cof subfamily protein (haloacid dehalogenase superfamily)
MYELAVLQVCFGQIFKLIGYFKGKVVEEDSNTLGRTSPSGLFVTDLDGTLLTDDRTISKKDLETLSSLQGRNVVTAIATGRSNFSFNNILDSLGFTTDRSRLPVDYVIFSTGAGIMSYPEKKILQSFSLPKADILNVCQYLEETRVDYMVQAPVPDTNHFVYRSHGEENKDFKRRIELYSKFAKPLKTPGREGLKNFDSATQVLCIVPEKNGHKVSALIAKRFPELSVIKATSPLDHISIWIEIFPPSVNKSSAVQWLCTNIGIGRGEVCAVGNDYNDEDLLDWAGAGFITQNGPDSLKEMYRGVASNNDSAVAEAASLWAEDSGLF